MSVVQVRNLQIGTGIPKICVPIIASNKAAILEKAKSIASVPADLVEWRIDWFEDVDNPSKVLELLQELRACLGDLPLLMTFRTKKEGGEKEITLDAYRRLNILGAQSGYVDLIDVEAFRQEDVVQEIISTAHAAHVKVIGSNHDFQKTPSKEEIISRLRMMQDMDVDIPKIAVMPRSKADVLALLSATNEMVETYADRPIITMSMASDGLISRLCGEVFGSSVTFGAFGEASAPGQMEAGHLKEILSLLHNSLS